MVATRPGWISADTKVYLYVDPWRLLVSAQSMWNPNLNMGTVTHQNIGYLFPMGPYYWLIHALGIPMWFGQRIWMSALFVIAGAGVLYLGRLLGLSPLGRLAGAMLYMLSPFVLDYMGRSSALLMPWSGFGWMIAFTVLAARRGGWRFPALFALVVAAVGGINATAILFTGLGPVLWLVYVGVLKEAPWRSVWRAAWRIGLLSSAVSLWWMAGLWAEAAYGIDVLRFTETIPTVLLTSSPSEVFRGLGYWYFYGWDRIQPWALSASQYIAHVFPILISFAVPSLAVGLGFFVRWRYRALAITLIVIGLVAAVSAYPIDLPTPFGAFLKRVDQTTIGLAMRSSNRALPLLLLGLALLLGAGLSAILATRFWVGLGATVMVLLVIMVNLAPLFAGDVIASNLAYRTPLPSYVHQAASALNSTSPSTRVLGIPGVDFGYYDWGVSMDQIWPGLLSRGWISRGSVPIGEPGSVNLIRALDESLQDGTVDPASIAPTASLMGAGSILFQGDLQYERYTGVRGITIWNQLQPTPAGLSAPTLYGPPAPTRTSIGNINDEAQLGLPTGATSVPSLAVYSVKQPRALIRTEPRSSPLIVAGDGEGILEAASFGLFGMTTPILYSASFPTASALKRVTPPGATLVVTDTNAKRLDRWGTLDSTYGFVQTAAEKLLVQDPSEQALSVFPVQTDATQTVAVVDGVKSVEATSYGNPINNTPEDQPFNAVDGSDTTAWVEGALEPATNQTLQITLEHPVTTTSVTLLQPQVGSPNRSITSATLRFDNKDPLTVAMDRSSLVAPGQQVSFTPKTFTTLEVTVTGVTGSKIYLSGLSAVGFAKVSIGGVPPATESLRMPTDLLRKLGSSSSSHPLVLLMHRLRSSDISVHSDPEPTLRRSVELNVARSFTLAGEARLSTSASDATINELLGRTTSTALPLGSSGVVPIVQSNSSSRLAGDLNASSWSAEDASTKTAWQSAFTDPVGQWLEFTMAQAVSFDHLDLQVVTDGRHQLPTSVTVSAGGASRTVTLPPLSLGVGRPQGSVSSVPILFPALHGSIVRLTIDAARTLSRHQIDLDGGTPPPVGIAELGIPGVVEPLTPTVLPANCSAQLLAVNGAAVPVTMTGSSSAALARQALSVATCPGPSASIALAKGRDLVTSGDGASTGWNLDLLSFSSPASTSTAALGPATASPSVKVTGSSQWSAQASVVGNGTRSWLVLGQSLSSGWEASVDGRSLGPPTLIDGYANGWKLPAIPAGTTAKLSFAWAPQHVINWAELLSLVSLLVVLGLCLWPSKRHWAHRALPFEDPQLASPLRYPGPARSWPVTVLAALLIGLFVGIFTAPFTGLAAVALSVAGLRFVWSRAMLLVGSVGSLALAGLYTAYEQHANIYPWNIGWPEHFGFASSCAWVALGLLVVDGAVEQLRERFGADGHHPQGPSDSELGSSPAAIPGDVG
jgi:arabinofuranan 3-O-arabinosyltransferase